MTQESEVDKKETERAQLDAELHCCPFCGVLVLNGETHKEDCFFSLAEKMRGSNGQDVVLAQKLADAWKKRAVPTGYKLVSDDFGSDAGRSFSQKHTGGFSFKSSLAECDFAILNDDVKKIVYPEIFKHLKSAW